MVCKILAELLEKENQEVFFLTTRVDDKNKKGLKALGYLTRKEALSLPIPRPISAGLSIGGRRRVPLVIRPKIL